MEQRSRKKKKTFTFDNLIEGKKKLKEGKKRSSITVDTDSLKKKRKMRKLRINL